MSGLSNSPKNEPTKSSTVVNGGAGGYKKPKGLLEAISEIQQLKVIETGNNVIDKDFFSVQQRLDYMSVGFRSGMKEAFFMVLVFPIFGWIVPSFITFFYKTQIGIDTQMFLLLFAFMPVLAYLGLCTFLSSLYKGQITKIAINTLLMGRSMVLAIIGFFIFFLYYMLYSVSLTKPVASGIINFFYSVGKIIPHTPKLKAYYDLFYYLHLRKDFLDIAISNIVILLLSALIPVFALYFKIYYKKYRKYQAMKKLEGQC